MHFRRIGRTRLEVRMYQFQKVLSYSATISIPISGNRTEPSLAEKHSIVGEPNGTARFGGGNA